MYENIPNELKVKKQWVLTKNKIPCDINRYRINAYDKKNWKTFEELNLIDFEPAFVFDNDYVGMDLDQCFENGELMEWAKPLFNNIKECYVETTRSGNGLHVIFKCSDYFKNKKGVNIKINKIDRLKNNPDKCGVEIYSNKRAFIFTGNVYKNYKSISQNSDSLIDLYKMLRQLLPNNNKKESNSSVFMEIKNKLTIFDIISSYNIIVKNMKCKCPFHNENNNSLTIYPFTNSYYCFGCQSGGDLIDFVAKIEDITQFEAAKLLNSKYNLGINFNNLRDPDADYDQLNVKWNPFYVLVEWADQFDNTKNKARLSEYYEIFKEIEPEQRPKIDKFKVFPVEQSVKALLDHYGIEVKYNLIKFDYDIFIKNIFVGPLERYIADIKNHAINHNLDITKEHLIDNLCLIGYKNQYNPWDEYLKKAHKYYLKAPDNKIFSKFMETISSSTENKELYIAKFLLQMVYVGCSSYESDIASDYMLVLKGAQYQGKTTWLKNLLPQCLQQDYFLKGIQLILDNKDSKIEVVSNILVELGEIETTFQKSDQEALKNFITNDRDKFRIPYSKTALTQKRHVCLCATTNDNDYLRDLTGTRRYLTLECESFNWDIKIDIDMLWGFFYEQYLKGKSYKFTHDQIKEINKSNERYIFKNEKILMIEEVFDVDPGEDGNWYKAGQIIELLPGGIFTKYNIGKELKKLGVKFKMGHGKQLYYYLKRTNV